MCKHTISHALETQGIKKHIPTKQPLLQLIDAKRRLAWAKAHRHWTVEDWRGVIWSDECSVERSKDPWFWWVFQSASECYYPDCVKGQRSVPDVKLMVWACFYWDTLGPLVPIIPGNLDSHAYYAILNTHLLPILQEVETQFQDPLFVQDNARPHTAHLIQQWLSDANVNVEKLPAHSPDINIIEQVWIPLKGLLQEKYPGIAEMKGGVDIIKARLAEVLPELWGMLEPEFLKALVGSMPSQIQAIIAARGWNTKY